ncbi:MAG: MMPL family transporter [Bacteroidota bacterium]
MRRLRIFTISLFAVLTVASVFFATQLKFTFNFDQFFPVGDPDLAFFKEFTADFENDANFMLIAIPRKEGVFEQAFLEKFHDFTLKTQQLDNVRESQSLTKFAYPLKTPFGITSIPAIHIDQPEKYEKDRKRLLQDERFVYNLIDSAATTLVVALKTVDEVDLPAADKLVADLTELVEQYDFENYHFLGQAYFQSELVKMQQEEVLLSAVISGILVSLIIFVLYRRPYGIAIALVSIALGMILFLGFLGATGRELSVMSALYPVLMIIVGTSDVIHIMSKYIDELRKGLPRKEAIIITIKEIGLATLLTSLTTAIGFASLLTSRIGPIKDFGINAAFGVVIAYLTVIFFTTALLSMFKTEDLIKLGRNNRIWEDLMKNTYEMTIKYPTRIAMGGLAVAGLSFYGISMITTNYQLENNLPIGQKITEDFKFFERQFAGYRPVEFGVFAQGDYKATDFAVLREMDKVEQQLKTIPYIKSVNSATTVYKSINQAFKRNKPSEYKIPEKEKDFKKYQRFAKRVADGSADILVSKDQKKARITTKILDIGADSIKAVGERIDAWITENTDPEVAVFKKTGSGIILDKNALYARESLLEGLGIAVIIISILMAILFKNWRMVLISLVPNVFPLVFAGGLLGYLGIELEAGVAILFAIVFGIAVDDTIHFLSKFKLTRDKGISIEESIRITFMETGKAICLTSIILFFGFLVMLFSVNPPSVTVGLMISVTLFTALFSDLLIIPLLIRWLMVE